MSGPRAAGANESNIPRRKEISSRDVYVWMGHGNEIPIDFNERRTVPDGKIVVLLAEHGKPVKSYRGEDIWKSMAKNPTPFLRPDSEETKGLLSETVHIYYPGDKIPKFLYYPFLVQYQRGKWSAYPSGVYKLNMAKAGNTSGYALPTNESGEMKKINVSSGPIPWNDIFSGEQNRELLANAKAKNSVIADISMYHRKEELEKVFVKESDDLLERLPNGIHYFMSCRLIKGQAAEIIDFINTLKKEIEKSLPFFNFIKRDRAEWIEDGLSEEVYNAKLDSLYENFNTELYSGPLGPIFKKSAFAKEEDYNESTNSDNMYSEYTIVTVFDSILKCINATNNRDRQLGPLTGEEYLDTFMSEFKEFKIRWKKGSNIYNLFEDFEGIVKDGLKPILEPVEKTRRKSLVQQGKGGKRTRKIKQKRYLNK